MVAPVLGIPQHDTAALPIDIADDDGRVAIAFAAVDFNPSTAREQLEPVVVRRDL